MAWRDTLLQASFRGVEFDCHRVDDAAQQATAEHAYPFIDGADIEDLGRGPRRISVTAIFYGDDYERGLRAFMQALDARGDGELIHPVFGALNVQVMDRRISHEAEHVDQAQVHVEFAESETGWRFFDQTLPSQKVDAIAAKGDVVRAAAADAMAAAVDAVPVGPMAQLDALREAMTGPLLDAMSMAQDVVFSNLDVLSFPRAWCNDISSAIDGVLNIRDWIGGTLTADWNSIRDLLSVFGLFTNGHGPAVPKPLAAGGALTVAQAAAIAGAIVAVQAAVGLADGAGRLLASEAQTPTLTPGEIEAVTDTAREGIDSAIASVRDAMPLETARTITEPLKDQALALQDAALSIIEARPPLIARQVTAPGNLRLLAHLWYGDHTRADELLRLNMGGGLRNPNFIQIGDQLNGYAA